MIRTSNRKCKEFVRKCEPFQANNLYARWLRGVYVVFSYGEHFPIYVCKSGVWYENTDRYSVSTSRHQSQAHPLVECAGTSTKGMQGLY